MSAMCNFGSVESDRLLEISDAPLSPCHCQNVLSHGDTFCGWNSRASSHAKRHTRKLCDLKNKKTSLGLREKTNLSKDYGESHMFQYYEDTTDYINHYRDLKTMDRAVKVDQNAEAGRETDAHQTRNFLDDFSGGPPRNRPATEEDRRGQCGDDDDLDELRHEEQAEAHSGVL